MESNIFIDPKYAQLIMEINKLKIDIAEKIAELEMLSSYIFPDIKNQYMLKIGVIEAELLSAKIQLDKINKKIVLYKDMIKSNINKSSINIDKIIDEEYKVEYDRYLELQKNIQIAIESTKNETITKENLDKMNLIFKDIIIRICPEINHNNTDLENNLYKLAIKTYHDGNLKKLICIKLFCDKNNLNYEFEVEDYEKLNEFKMNYQKILEEVKKKILDIRSSEMFANKYIIEDENLIRRRKNEINNNINDISKEYSKALKTLDNLEKNINSKNNK